MAAAFGTLIERLVGAQVYFALDGTAVGGSSPFTTPLSSVVKIAAPTTGYADYSLGRVASVKYDPIFKETTREWASSTGGYKERKDKKIVSDAFVFTCIDFAPQLYDQLMWGLAALATAASHTVFASATRYKDGWLYARRINEAGTAIGLLEIHARLSIDSLPDDKNEYISPVWRVAHLADAGALDTITIAAG